MPFVSLTLAAALLAADPCVSGLMPGQRPGPYAALVAVGPQRGTSHCFVCETEDRPAVIVFARRPTESLGKLLRGLDKALADPKAKELRAWVTFLSDDQLATDPLVVKWSQQQGVKRVPLGVFEDVQGPPAYKLHRDADVTILLSVKQKVVRNFAFRPDELTEERLAEVLKAVPAISAAAK